MRESAPPGWYPDGTGNERWWDGQQWTEHTVAPPTDISPPSEPANPEAEPKPGGLQSTIVSWPFGRTVVILSLLMFCGLPLLPLYLWRVGKLSAKWGIGLAVVWLLLAVGIVATLGDPKSDAIEDTSSKVADKPNPNEKEVVLLFVTDLKDGDSWVASDGKEYRLGLVNTPERNETCGQEARSFTSEYLDEGFTVDAYSTDTHSRTVAEVFDKDGHSLNVALAKSGLGNGKYLEEFRHENPDLGKRLDAAFAEAPKPECQISAEEAAAAAAAAAEAERKQQEAQRRQLVQEPGPSNCTPGYSPCLAPRADWDCGEIGHPVAVTGLDPYGLDRDGDGTGCD